MLELCTEKFLKSLAPFSYIICWFFKSSLAALCCPLKPSQLIFIFQLSSLNCMLLLEEKS